MVIAKFSYCKIKFDLFYFVIKYTIFVTIIRLSGVIVVLFI